MAISFPASPTEGQIFNASPGRSFVYRAPLWRPAPLATALPKNYVVNPAMQHSQENGDVVRFTGSNYSYYPADTWKVTVAMAPATGTVGRDPANRTPAGAHSLAVIIVAPSATAAGSLFYEHKIEGVRSADLNWGTAAAKQIVLRFQFWSSAVGLFSVAVQNASTAATRSYLGTINVTVPNSWQLHTLVIPGDTTGTWVTTNAVGLKFLISMFGYNNIYAGVEGWQAGDKGWLITNYNAPANGGTFRIGDVGLYADPYLTGVAPPFEVPEIGRELRRCQRHWYKQIGGRGVQASASTVARAAIQFPTQMRAIPSLARVGAAAYWSGGSSISFTGYQTNNCNTLAFESSLNGAAGTTGRPAIMHYKTEADYTAVSARL